jgi:hypothetical protein
VQATQRLASSRFIGLLLAAGLVATWLTIVFVWPVQFWEANNDYVYLSLAHAINFETLLHGRLYSDSGLLNHPGVPFYFASWLGLRAAALSNSGSDIVQSVLSDPGQFFMATRIIAGLIGAAAVGTAWALLSGVTAPWRLLAILAFFAGAPASFRYGLVLLGNETFALPLAVLLFWAIGLCARASPAANWPWLLLGAVAGLGYTVKLLYLDLLVAAVAVAAIDSCWVSRRPDLTLMIGLVRRTSLVAIAFLAVAGSILIATLGRGGLIALLQFHKGIFTHSGMYGSGESGFVSNTAVYDALVNWFAELALPYLLILVVAGLFLIVRRKPGISLDRLTVLWISASLAAMLSAVAAVLKHFDTHYVVAICAILPFAFLPVLAQRRIRWIAAAGILASLGFTGFHVAREFSQESTTAAALMEDETAIAAMPLLPGEARLWTYRVPSEKFAAAFIATYSGVEPLIASLADPARQEFSSYSAVDRRYRYIVLDSNYFKSADDVRQFQGSLDRTQAVMVRLAPEDQIHMLKRLIVVGKHDR